MAYKLIIFASILAYSSAFPQPQTAFENISQKDLDSYSEAFKLFDKDSNGFVSVDEFAVLMESVGLDVPAPSVLKFVLDEWDTDGDGVLSLEEMVTQMAGIPKEDRNRSAFNTFDSDNDNLISPEEMKTIMDNLGLTLTNQEIGALYVVFDVDKDGFLNFEEYSTAIASKKK